MPNGIDLILADHSWSTTCSPRSTPRDGAIIGLVDRALTAHDEAEQAALYPLAGQLLGDADMIERSAPRTRMSRSRSTSSALEGPPLIAAFEQLRRLVTEHVADEEKNLLPALAEAATPQQLEGLGARIMQAKQRGG